jgi:hypothetical protein
MSRGPTEVADVASGFGWNARNVADESICPLGDFSSFQLLIALLQRISETFFESCNDAVTVHRKGE